MKKLIVLILITFFWSCESSLNNSDNPEKISDISSVNERRYGDAIGPKGDGGGLSSLHTAKAHYEYTIKPWTPKDPKVIVGYSYKTAVGKTCSEAKKKAKDLVPPWGRFKYASCK